MRRLVILFICCCAAPAQATLTLYDGFNYTVAAAMTGQTNPSNSLNYFQAGPAGRTNTIVVASGNLTVPPLLQPATGNSVTIKGQGASANNGTADRLSLGGAITSGTVYYSFALRIDALTGSTNVVGGFFIGLNNSTGAQATNPSVAGARVQARIDPNDATKYQLGIFNTNAAAGAASWVTPTLNVGDTHFIVAAYTFNPGTGDDVGSIWIDPGSLGAGTAPTPTMTVTGNDISGNSIASILLRQSPAPHLTMDELRVGTDWASVTPVFVPEPAAYWFLLLSSALVLAWQKMVKPLVNTMKK